MIVNPRRPLFYRPDRNGPYRSFLWTVLILLALWFLRQVDAGAITPPFAPTPTATRTALSFVEEGDAYFVAGQLDAAIQAYQDALRIDPQDAEVWAKLARIQTYSTALLTTDNARRDRLQEALQSADQAVTLSPDSSNAHAIRAFVLDWYASPIYVGDRATELLTEAEQEVVRALQLDNQNVLALAFYAEILVDEQKWTQAQQYIEQAVARDDTLMDVHRVYAYVLETLGQYNQAIQEYDKAIALAPNLTFLYLRAGANYRRLAFGSPVEAVRMQLYEKSLEYFARAAAINEQLGVRDPIPYLSIARTYSQMGEFFIAARNVQKALSFSPADADIYGQLGVIYFKSRNYEGSIPALKCAVEGCSPEESCEARGGCDDDELGVQVVGLPLTNNTVVYYYTYVSVLAALSRPQQNYCPKAMDIAAQVRAMYAGDALIMGIIQPSERICASLQADLTPAP